MLFDVRILGFSPGTKDPVAAMMRVFKVDESTAAELVGGAPRVVKRGVPIEQAQKFCELLARTGAKTEIFSSGARARTAPKGAFGGETGRFVLPEPNHEAIGSALSRTPDNGNAFERESVAPPAVQLRKMRASQVHGAVEAPADVGLLALPQVNALPQGALPARALLDPVRESLVASAPMMRRDTLEADIEPPSRTSSASWAELARRSAPPGARTSEGPLFQGRNSSAPLLRESQRPRGRTHSALGVLAELEGPALEGRVAALPGADVLVIKASTITIVMLVSLSLITLGMLPVIMFGYWLFDLCKRWSRERSLASSAVRATRTQLPELHHCLRVFGQRLGLPNPPQLFVSGGVRPGVSTTVFAGEVRMLLSADTLADAIESDRCHTLGFMLAHELSAVALGQHGVMHAFLAWLWPAVRKFDVLSADALAVELMNDRSRAQAALLTLLMGPRIANLLDLKDLERQAEEHASESLFYAPALEGQSEFLLSRLHRLRRS